MPRPILEVVPPNVDAQAAQAARVHQGQLTKPAGALAVLEEIAIALAAIQGRERPRARPAEALLFAADHPVAAHGVSAYPAEVTAQMVANFIGGGAAASVLCRTQGIPLTVIDVGVARPIVTPGEGRDGVRLIREDVANDEEGDLLLGQAMSIRTFERAVTAGIEAVDRLAEDTRILILGEMGIGNSTCAAAVAAALLGRDGAELTGSGTGVVDGALARKREVVQRAAALVYGRPPSEILAAVGGRELAAIAGAVGRAAERGICVLVDGFIVSAAVLAAVQASPGILPYLLFGHCSAEPGHRIVLEAMQARPLLELGLRLGEGTGALAAFPLVELACVLHDEMATFSSAGVAEVAGVAGAAGASSSSGTSAS
jgi:nicotinate-nucleotide--dimethylbenzimidazole phosphoribosyltransferase